MCPLQDLVSDFLTQEKPVCSYLDESQLLNLAIVAVRFYAGYSSLESVGHEQELVRFNEITAETEINTSEWALILPLFRLYVEREETKQLEASRGMGIDPYGRNSSEIQADITSMENDFALRAFCQPITVI